MRIRNCKVQIALQFPGTRQKASSNLHFSSLKLYSRVSTKADAQRNRTRYHATIRVDLLHPLSSTGARRGRRASKENQSSPGDNLSIESRDLPTLRHSSRVRPASQRNAGPRPCRHRRSRRPGRHVAPQSDERSIVDETSESI